MPGGDRTGPNGIGPMTGRAAGLCVGNDIPFAGRVRSGAFGRRGGGRGLRPGRGRGFGPGFGRAPGWNGVTELGAEERRTAMAAELDALEKRTDLLRREIESLDTGRGGDA